MSKLSRRDVFRQAAGTLGALAAAPSLFSAARKKLPIGVQLYSVRQTIGSDIPGTIATIKKLGYDGVEFAGYYDKSAKEWRQLLDDNGLKCCGTHIGLNTMTGDQLKATIEFNQILGTPFLIVPMLASKTLEGWAKYAEAFKQVAAQLKPVGMAVGYHTHTAEFVPVEGQLPMDYFFDRTGKDVVMQLDIGHCVHAKADPVAYLKKYAGRARTVHVKDWSFTKKEYSIGDGEVPWTPVLDALATVAGTEWYTIEEETGAYPGTLGIEKSIQGLRKLLA
jgi:sugar phosphate isomerase/epimerase